MGRWAAPVRAAAEAGDVRRAMVGFDAAVDEWLRHRLGRPRPEDGPVQPPARWGAPTPKQSGASGDASDARADAALLA
eukprot:2429410-Lingulodinium_polyedra.AAC.1